MSSLGEEFDGPESSQIISELLSQFMTPEMAGFLSTPISKALGDVTNNRVSVPGGVDIPLGMGDMFAGPRSIEMQASNQFMQNAINNSLYIGEDVKTGVKQNIRDNLSQFMTGQDASTGISALNMASDFFLYGSMGLDQMQENMHNAGRYMGVTAPFLAGDAELVSKQTSNYSTLAGLAIADRAYNGGKYGTSAADTGILFSELARTGSFSNMNTGEVGFKDIASFVQTGEGDIEASVRPQLESAKRQIRAASELVGEFQRIFKTDVAQSLDKINSLFGTDVANTFSPERQQEITRSISASGMASGFTSQQIVGLGAASQQQAAAAGFDDFTGGLTAGIMSAQLFRASANEEIAGGDNFAFVNERRYRDTLVRRTTGARLSGLSRDISGAAAIIKRENGEAAVDDFLSVVNSQEGQLSSEQVADIARGYGDETDGSYNRMQGISAGDLRDASYSQEGRRYLERGVGDVAVLRNNAGFMSDVRRQTTDHVLKRSGMSAEARADFFNSVDGPLTSVAIRDALGTEGGGVADDLERIFTQNARAFGFGTMEEADLFMNTLERNKQLSALQVSTGKISNLQGYIGKVTDSISGFEALGDLFLEGDVGDKTLGEIVKTFTGAKEVDAAALFGDNSVFNSDKALKGRAKSMRQITLGAATSVLFGGKFGDKAATQEQRDVVNRMFDSSLSEEERVKATEELETMVQESTSTKELMFEHDVSQRRKEQITAMGKNEDGSAKTLTGKQSKAIRQAAFLEQFEGAGDLKLIEGDKDSDEEVKFRKLLASAKVKFAKRAAGETSDDLTDTELGALKKAKNEAMINDNIAGVKGTGSDMIAFWLESIFDSLTTFINKQ